MAIYDPFVGNALNAVDAKGRVSLPAGYRQVIELRQQRMAPEGSQAEAPKQVTFMVEKERGCLIGFDASMASLVVEARAEQADAAAKGDIFAMHKQDRGALKGAWTVSYDPSGRMVLPDFLRDKASIGDLAFFHHAGRFFEVWNPNHYLASQDPEDADDQEQLAYLLRTRSRND